MTSSPLKQHVAYRRECDSGRACCPKFTRNYSLELFPPRRGIESARANLQLPLPPLHGTAEGPSLGDSERLPWPESRRAGPFRDDLLCEMHRPFCLPRQVFDEILQVSV